MDVGQWPLNLTIVTVYHFSTFSLIVICNGNLYDINTWWDVLEMWSIIWKIKLSLLQLTAKNIQCMRTLLNLAHCNGAVLGTSWQLVLATLQVLLPSATTYLYVTTHWNAHIFIWLHKAKRHFTFINVYGALPVRNETKCLTFLS